MSVQTSRGQLLLIAILAAFLGVVAAGCSGEDDQVVDGDGSPTSFEIKPTINLVVNDWTASALNVAVAEQIIERQLGYPVVPTRIDDTTELYDGLAEGTLDAVLEIWPSDLTDRDRLYFDRGEVVDLGPLGPRGKVGWFTPRYVIDEYPEFATWEGLQDNAAASVFASSDTQPRGRLLGTNPSYRQFDEEIIDNLGLPFELVFSGSEEETMAELEASYEAGEPILLYWWTPTSAVGAYDLVNVTLPEPTEECLAAAESGGSGVDCDYAVDELFKASSPGLVDKAPEIDSFLRTFSLSNDDQVAMLAAVENEGLSIGEAATNWIEANESTWQAWLN